MSSSSGSPYHSSSHESEFVEHDIDQTILRTAASGALPPWRQTASMLVETLKTSALPATLVRCLGPLYRAHAPGTDRPRTSCARLQLESAYHR